MTQHTPGPLRVIMRGPDHDAIITEAGGVVANVNRQRRETTVSSNAAELVRRWNTHGAMLEALRETMAALTDITNAAENGEAYTFEELAKETFQKPINDAFLAITAAEGK